jgi:NADH-quinone oxidoreductase subunit N
MSLDQAFAASPLVVLALAGVACLLAISFAKRKAEAAFAVCAIGMAAAIASSIALSLPRMPLRIEGLLSMDGLSFIGTAIILASGLAIALASRPYLARREGERGEYYALLLFATLGASVLAASSSLATLFLGLELLSVSLYALVAYRREGAEGTKAAFTYLILASVASAFLLFGMALAYFQTGSLELSRATQAAADGSGGPLIIAAFAMMGVGFAFKLAVAPFHMWAPEVYEGSTAPVAALIATVSKAAMAIPLVRILAPRILAAASGGAASSILWIVAALSGVSMIAGNLLALREDRVKRMLAGSSIAQIGYILVALIAGGDYGTSSALFYLAAYSLSTLGAFACVAALSPARSDSSGRADARREDFRGLYLRRPLVSAVMTASLLSLAGMPLTAGFIGKFMIFAAGVRIGNATRILAVLLALNSAVSLFYYLRLVSLIYRRPETEREGAVGTPKEFGGAAVAMPKGSFLAGVALALIGLSILLLGTAPGPALSFIAALAVR